MGGALILSSTFLLITFFIFYQYAESLDLAKDALNTTGAFFGGVATLWAACVAAYLFNDWREQHNTEIEYEYIRSILEKIRKNHISVNFIKDEIFKLYLKPLATYPKTCVLIDIETMTNIKKYIQELRLLAHEHYLISKDDSNYLYYLKYDIFLNEFVDLLEKLFSQEGFDRYNLQIALLKESKIIATPINCQNSYITFEYQKIELFQILERLESTYTDLMIYIADTKVKI